MIGNDQKIKGTPEPGPLTQARCNFFSLCKPVSLIQPQPVAEKAGIR